MAPHLSLPRAIALALTVAVACVAIGAIVVPPLAAGTQSPAQAAPIQGMRYHTCPDCVISLTVVDGAAWAGTVNAGVARHDLTTGAVTRFSVAEGLGGRGVYMVDVATDGHVWAAHYRDVNTSPRTGISHFDGSAWRRYDAASGLPGTRVNDIEALPGGAAWVATENGFARFDGTAWRTFTAAETGQRGEPLAVAVAPDGTAYCGTSLGLVRFKDGTWTDISMVDLPTQDVWDLAVDSAGHVWAMQAPGVAELDPTAPNQPDWTFHDIGRPDWDPSQGWRQAVNDRIFVDRQDRVAVVVGTTAYVRDGAAWRTEGAADRYVAEAGHWPSVLTVTPTGGLWLGLLTEGLAEASDATWRRHLVGNTPTNYAAYSVEVGTDGALWFGFMNVSGDDNLLNGFGGGAWSRIDSRSGLPLGGALGICQRCLDVDRSGRVWVASSEGPSTDGWIAWPSGTTWAKATVADAFGDRTTIHAVAGDHRGGVWAGSGTRGAAHLEGGRWRRYTRAEGLPSDEVRALAVAPNGSVWFGSGAGATRLHSGSMQTFTATDGLLAEDVLGIEVDERTGHVWFAGSADGVAGVTSYDGTSWRSYGAADGLRGDAAWGVAFGSDGSIWAAVASQGATGGGIARLVGERWTMITSADGLLGQTGYDVAVDRGGNVWVATDAGITEFLLAPTQATLTPPPSPTPEATPTPAADEPIVCPQLQGKVPQAAIDSAIADPSSVSGWLRPQDPGKPPSRFNPLRRALGVSRPSSPYHPLFNPLVWKVGCP